MLAGRSPVLSPAQIRHANATDGLSLVVLHFGLRNPDLTDERTQRALQAGMAGFFFFHGGYRLKILLQEIYGQQHADFVVAGGGHLLSDMGHATGTPSGSRG